MLAGQYDDIIIPDHRPETTTWEFTAAQHFSCFQRELRILGVSHQRCTLMAFVVVELLIIGFNIVICLNSDAVAVGLLKGPLNAAFKKECAHSIKTGSPKKLQTVSVLLQSSHLVSLQSKTTRKSHHQLPQPPRCNGECRGVFTPFSTELCPHRLASRSVTSTTQ